MSRTARLLVLLSPLIAGAVAAYFVPAIEQDQAYHRFADARAWLGIPNTADVLSNFPFVLVGFVGLALLPRFSLIDSRERWMWGVFFAAQALTGFGSAWYHAAPDDARLVWDRLPLTGVIMGLVAISIAERVDVKAGWRLLGPLLLLGIASIVAWRTAGDLRLYAIVQFGSILSLLLTIALFRSPYTHGSGYAWAIGLYVVAKGCELFDARILATTGFVSGHTLKHVIAGLSGAAILLMTARRQVRNEAKTG